MTANTPLDNLNNTVSNDVPSRQHPDADKATQGSSSDRGSLDENIVFYDGMSDEELDQLLKASLGDEALATDTLNDNVIDDNTHGASNHGADHNSHDIDSHDIDSHDIDSHDIDRHDIDSQSQSLDNDTKSGRNDSTSNHGTNQLATAALSASDRSEPSELDADAIFALDELILTDDASSTSNPISNANADSALSLNEQTVATSQQPDAQQPLANDASDETTSIGDDYFDLTEEFVDLQTASHAPNSTRGQTTNPSTTTSERIDAAKNTSLEVADPISADTGSVASTPIATSMPAANSNPSVTTPDDISATINTTYALTESPQLQHISEQISSEMALLKSHLHVLSLQFHELGNISARLMQQLRQLQSGCMDDFSITYEQMLELRQHLVASKQQASAMPSLLDLVEEALESEMYVAQTRNKR